MDSPHVAPCRVASDKGGVRPGRLSAIRFSDESGVSLLLDTYPGAAAAYSLRKLRADYAGSAIRVRRSSDDGEQDIGFDGNDLDESALTTFVGAGDGFIVKVYDQSGNGLDCTQSTATSQVQIVDTGTVLKMGGIHAVRKPGSADDDPGYLTSGVANGNWSTNMYAVWVIESTDTTAVLFSSTSLAGSWFGYHDDGSSTTNIAGNSGTPSWRKNGSVLSPQPTTRDDLHTQYLTGSVVVASASAIDMDTDTDWTNLCIWGWNNQSASPTNLTKMGDVILYDNPSTETMEGVEEQLKTDYGVS